MKKFDEFEYLPPIIAIVQARMGSERFPGKMMANLCGHPLIWWVLKRLSKSSRIKQIVVASPDAELAQYAQDQGLWGYLDNGDPNNVLGRYMRAANWSNAEIVVRICGDCPLIDAQLVDQCIEEYLNSRVDIVTNVMRRSFPKGLDVEVLHRNCLKRIYHLTENPTYREHVTLFAYENPSLFVVKNVTNNGLDHSYLNVSVDTPKDLDKIKELLSVYGENVGYREIIRYFT